MSLALNRSNTPRLTLKGLGLGLCLALFALNIWLLRDSINFELPDHGGAACHFSQRYLGIHLAPVLFLMQLIPAALLSIYMRRWLVLAVSVLPFWLIVYVAACGHY